MQAPNLRIPRPSKPSITRRPLRSRPPEAEVGEAAVVEYLARLSPEERASVVERAERRAAILARPPAATAVPRPATPPASASIAPPPPAPARVTKMPPPPAPDAPVVAAPLATPSRQTLNSTDLEVLAEAEAEEAKKRSSSVPPPLPVRPRVSMKVAAPAAAKPASVPPPAAAVPASERETVPAPDSTRELAAAIADERRPTTPAPMPAALPVAARVSVPEATDILFESMHELSFFETAIEGASFCLVTALRVVPCLAGIVHLFDAETREYVAVYAQGPRSERVLRSRRPDSDPLFVRASLRRAPLVIEYGTNGAPKVAERHASFGDPWSVLVVPVMHGGRVLAVIELVDPVDPFSEVAVSAMAYVAEKYGEFLAEKGIVLRSVVPPSLAEANAR